MEEECSGCGYVHTAGEICPECEGAVESKSEASPTKMIQPTIDLYFSPIPKKDTPTLTGTKRILEEEENKKKRKGD